MGGNGCQGKPPTAEQGGTQHVPELGTYNTTYVHTSMSCARKATLNFQLYKRLAKVQRLATETTFGFNVHVSRVEITSFISAY